MDFSDSDLFVFQTFSDINGKAERVQIGRRNGQVAAFFHPHIRSPSLSPHAPKKAASQVPEQTCAGLTELERRTWLRLVANRSVAEIAREDKVSRPAIYERIRGKNGQGGMVGKNPYIALWWRMREQRTKK